MLLPAPLNRIAIVASASGSGKTTLGRILGERLSAPFIELDALRHGPNWRIATTEEMRAKLTPIAQSERWVMDGTYGSIGTLISDRADLIVWLDLPPWVWFPRLIRRSARRLWRNEELWNGNRESIRGVLFERDGVIPHAVRAYFFRRRKMERGLAQYRFVRLQSVAEVESFTAAATRSFGASWLPATVARRDP